MKLINIFFTILLLMILSGCNFLKPVKTPVISVYELSSIPRPAQKRNSNDITILVSRPTSKSVYNTTKMIYSTRPHQLEYYAVTQWAKMPSKMLEPLVARTLQRTHYFHAVVTPPFVGGYQYVLNTKIVNFQQDFTRKRGVFLLCVQAEIIDALKNKVIASKVISKREPIYKNTPYSGVLAANRATRKMLASLAYFTVYTLSNIKGE